MRVWSLLGHLSRSEQVVWHICALEVPGVRQFEADVQECTTHFEMLPWTRHDDQAPGVTIHGVAVLENQERWQMDNGPVYTLQYRRILCQATM